MWSYGMKCKPVSVKNPQANAILERIHAIFMNIVHTTKLDIAELVKASDIHIFLSDMAWAICSTYPAQFYFLARLTKVRH